MNFSENFAGAPSAGSPVKRVGFLGCGTIGKALVAHLSERTDAEVAFIQAPHYEKSPQARYPVVRACDEALLKRTDLVVECANAQVLFDHLEAVLRHCDLLPFSVTAFADREFEARAKALCREHGRHIYLPHGAIFGLDGIFDGRRCWEKVTVETQKSPKSLGRNDTETAVLYDGPTREACRLFPRNVNVHAAVALAGLGFDRTFSRIVSVPGKTSNDHLITLEGAGVRFRISVNSHAAGQISGKYTPLSACGSLDRALGRGWGMENV